MSALLESWYADLRARGIEPGAFARSMSAIEASGISRHRDRDAEIERREGWDTREEPRNG